MPNCLRSLLLLAFSAFALPLVCQAADGVWTDAKDKSLPADFKLQGEYQLEADELQVGAQVIALGDGKFQVVVIPGGLPKADHPAKNVCLLDGTLQANGSVQLAMPKGQKRYLANKPEEFSARKTFPPAGQKLYAGGKIEDGRLMLLTAEGKTQGLEKVLRKSPTLGLQPPGNAVVLFKGDASDMQHWKGGRFDKQTKLLNTDGKDILTAKSFNDYTMHIEFLLPYKPKGRGQGRGNSGFYQVDHYEVQILDSFGLEGLNNECGGVYQIKDPDVNMCFPPLSWQTYDVEFKNARRDANGKVTEPAKMTVRHNGVVIHKEMTLPRKTGGSRRGAVGTPGPMKLQGHGNPLQFRNVWIVPATN